MTIPMLKKLLLRRFRSFPGAEIQFDNPTFLVGRNGAGKSNLADAFSFLSEAMTPPLSAVFERRAGFAAVVNRRSSRGRPSNLGLRVDMLDLDEATSRANYAFELQYLKDYGFKVVRERCFLRLDRGFIRFDRNEKGFTSNVKSLDPPLVPNALALPLIGGDARFRPIWDFLSGMHVYRIDPTVLRGMQDPDSGVPLHSNGRNAVSIIREIRRIPNDWKTFLALLKSIVPGTTDLRSIEHGDKFSLELTQEWTNSDRMRFESYNLSDGTLRSLGLLTAVFQRPRPSVLVIEEPEATMHPGALGAVLDLLSYAKDFMQVVVTTHSSDLLDAKWIKDGHLRIINWEDGVSRASPVSKAARGVLKEHIMEAGELMRSNALTAASTEHPLVRRNDSLIENPSQVPLFGR